MPAPKTLILTSTYPEDLSPPGRNRNLRLHRRLITVLHIASLLASFIAVTLFAAAIPRWNSNFIHTTGPNRGDWTDGMPLGPLGFALIYHAIVLIHRRTQQVRRDTQTRSRSSYRSGPSLSRLSLLIHTAVPILIMLSLLPALLLAGYGSLFRFWQPAIRTQSGILICNMLNVFARECEPTLYLVGSLQIAGIAFGSFVWACHFVLLLVSLRNLRRHVLVKQLQREKLAQYASPHTSAGSGERWGKSLSHSHSRSGRRNWRELSRSRSRSGPDHHHHHAPRHEPSSRSNAKGQQQPTSAQDNTERQDVPIVFLQAPEESHLRV